MTARLAFGYNDGLLDGVKAAWGARWIVTQDGAVDHVHDRQDVFAEDDRELKLLAWLDGKRPEFNNESPFRRAQGVLRERLRLGDVNTRVARPMILHQDSEGAVVANTNGSGGYCYVAAYRYEDLPDGCPTKGLDRVLSKGGDPT